MAKETLRCVGGPFDGQEVTTLMHCTTLIRHSSGGRASAHEPLGSSADIVRHTYSRQRGPDGREYWQFKTSEPLYLVAEAAV